MQLHSNVSKAFSNSTKRKSPDVFFASKYSIMSLKSLMFWPMYLPLTNPVWSELTSFGKNLSTLCQNPGQNFVVHIEKGYRAPVRKF